MIRKILLTTVCLIMLIGTAGAAKKPKLPQLKVAVVDMDNLFQEYYKTKNKIMRKKQS